MSDKDLEHADRTPGGSETRYLATGAVVFATVSTLAIVDLISDFGEGTTAGHVVTEGLIVVAGAVGLAIMAARYRSLRRREQSARAQARELSEALDRSVEEGKRWRAEAADLMHGLGALIGQQFGRWDLTPAERDVARLLLKGFSHKEIARLRGVGEHTARQQATAVYRKAQVEGRHELAAFFLEDLVVPEPGNQDATTQ